MIASRRFRLKSGPSTVFDARNLRKNHADVDRLAARSEDSDSPLRSVDAATSENSSVNGEPFGNLGSTGMMSSFPAFSGSYRNWTSRTSTRFYRFRLGEIDTLLAIPDEERATAAPPLQTVTLQREQFKISRTILSSDRNGFPCLAAIPAFIQYPGRNAVPIGSHAGLPDSSGYPPVRISTVG